jgi:hypothetical protein
MSRTVSLSSVSFVKSLERGPQALPSLARAFVLRRGSLFTDGTNATVGDGSHGGNMSDDVVQQAADALRAWQDVFQKCIVPKSVATDQARYLSKTIRFLRKNKHALSHEQVDTLTQAGMIWEVPSTVESKWWSNFHTAKAFLDNETDSRRLQDFLNDDMEDPHPFQDADADVVEASRWLGRQRVLYRRQKLTLMQVDLLKRALGVRLVRQRGKARRNKHKAILDADAEFLRRSSVQSP